MQSLCLLNPVMILESPEKSKIVYSVLKKVADIEETFSPLAKEIKKKHRSTEKKLMNDDTSHIYLYLKSILREEMTDPIGYPDVSHD